MANGITYNFQYNSILITRYVYSLPFWRRVLARYFEKYRVTKKEYDEWFNNLDI